MIEIEALQSMLETAEEPILSLYLNVDPALQENQAQNPAWRIWLKNTLREIEAQVLDDQRAGWQAIREQVEARLDDYRPDAKGLALFTSASRQDEFALPVSLENQAAFGAPLIAQLMWAIDEYEPYLIALVDKENARFFSAYLGSIDLQDQMAIDLDEYDFLEMTLNPGSGGVFSGVTEGSNRDSFEAMIDEHRARFFREVAARIEALAARHDIERVILGGLEGNVSAVQSELSQRLADRVVGMINTRVNVSASEILANALPLALDYEREQESELLRQVIDLAKSGGRGALGYRDVMEALEQQRVELLIAPWPLADESLAQELPLRVMQSGIQFELIYGEAAETLINEGGLAARLYYALPSDSS